MAKKQKNQIQAYVLQAIVTKWIGPTDCRGSRIVAKCGAGKITVSWNYSLNVFENHKVACKALCEKLDSENLKKYGAGSTVWTESMIGGCMPDNSGYCFVFSGKGF